MKERGMLFSGPMVRALLDGGKTQTRRVMDKKIVTWDGDAAALMRLLDQVGRSCPYGQSGDRIWVRESFRTEKAYDSIKPSMLPTARNGKTLAVPFWYQADFQDRKIPFVHKGLQGGKLRPGMFMPRAASRIDLEITGVRVERLQDISEAHAAAEGIAPNWIGSDLTGWNPEDHGYLPHDTDDEGNVPGVDIYDDCWTAKRCYQRLWESLNGPGSWDANPWVWVIEFKRL